MEIIGFADGLNAGYEKKIGTKSVTKVFGLSHKMQIVSICIRDHGKRKF